MVNRFSSLIKENLSITQSPVSEYKHENGSFLQELDSFQVKFGIINRRLSKVVSQTKSLNNIHIENSK